MLYKTYCQTKIGHIEITTSEDSITNISFLDNYKIDENIVTKNIDEPEILITAKKQITEYFLKQRTDFDLKLKLQGTDFQNSVWNELLKIPYGQTISYLQLAQRIGNQKASRAVANANSKNKIPIIIPCHRVIGSNGKLVGYASGIDRKQFLLNLETNILH